MEIIEVRGQSTLVLLLGCCLWAVLLHSEEFIREEGAVRVLRRQTSLRKRAWLALFCLIHLSRTLNYVHDLLMSETIAWSSVSVSIVLFCGRQLSASWVFELGLVWGATGVPYR